MTEKSENLNDLRSEGDLNISPLRKKWQQEFIDPETRKWLELDKEYFLHQSLSTPCLDVLTGCEGPYLQNLQGRKILDFHGNNVHQVGFANRRVVQAINDQMEQLAFCTRRYTNIPAIKLAQKLAQLAPGNLNKVLLAPSGTAAVGMALKLARIATGRFKTISMWDSFHGASLDAISVGGETIFRNGAGPLLPGCEHVPPPDDYRCLWDCQGQCNLRCGEYVEYILEKEGDVGAVIAEPVRASSVIPTAEYWQKIRAACDKHGALLIMDDIPNGLGRTGKMFTCEHFGVVPDILVLGKGLGGGIFPLAAMLTRQDLDVAPDRALGHYTHEKNPVACAAAMAAIEFLEEENILEHVNALGMQALNRMEAMQQRHRIIGKVRGLGLLLGMELVTDRQTKEKACEQAEAVMYAALAKGLSFKVTMGNILTLSPPLTITQQQMNQALDILDDCLAQIQLR